MMPLKNEINWKKVDGLLPVIIQCFEDYSVLMLGYMNEDALNETLRTGLVTFYSRTKQRLWVKGEESGNHFHVKDMFLDCDKDTLLIHVICHEHACHTGSRSCFSKDDKSLAFSTFLEKIIKERVQNKTQSSYTAALFQEGKHRIAQKVGEEAVEVVIASMEESKKNLLEESADLIFHLMLNLHYHNIKYKDVLAVLKERRMKNKAKESQTH